MLRFSPGRCKNETALFMFRIYTTCRAFLRITAFSGVLCVATIKIKCSRWTVYISIFFTHFQETPVPGTYDIKDFLQESEQSRVKQTYNFKGEGRKKSLRTARNGYMLLPGAYEHQDFLHSLEKLPLTYQFKSDGRRRMLPGIKDRDCNASPCQYETARKQVEKSPVQ